MTRWIDRRSVYAVLGIPEVWSHDGRSLNLYLLQADGEYRVSQASKAFPELPLPEIVRFLDQRASLDETSLLRAFRDWIRERFGTGQD